jgi:hypothetical protein
MKNQANLTLRHPSNRILRSLAWITVGCVLQALAPVTVSGQSPEELIETARSMIQAERQETVAQALQLTSREAEAFWPVYHRYRVETQKIGDGVKNLVLEYAQLYPDVPEARAKSMLKELLAWEKKQTATRAYYVKKVGKILPAGKTLRFAQVESRLDLAVRLEMAAGIPLVPVTGKLGGRMVGAAAYAEGEAGGLVIQTAELRATVVATDAANRRVTLMDRNGFKQTVKVGPEAINFTQIQVGDELKLLVTEELLVRMADENTPAGNEAAALVALTPKGAKPGGVLAEVRQVTGTIKAINTADRTATLQFETGDTKTFPVRRDVDLSKYKVGEKVVFQVTEMIALKVEKP